MQSAAAMQVTPEKRAQAKQMAYGLLYGMGKHALARNMGVPPDTAQQLSDSFRASIPDLVCSILNLVKLLSQAIARTLRTRQQQKVKRHMHLLNPNKHQQQYGVHKDGTLPLCRTSG